MTDERLYNSRIIKTFVEFLKIHYPNIDARVILDYAEISSYELEDEGHWLTQQQVDRFYDILVQKTGNPKIAREVGRYAPFSIAAGAVPQYALGFLTPKTAYNFVGKVHHYITRSCNVSTKSLGSNTIEITVEPKPGVVEKLYQCENRLGMYEAMSKLFTGNYANIEHSQCMHKNGKICVYRIQWEQPRSLLWKWIRNYSSILGITLSFALFFMLPEAYRLVPILLFALSFILLSLRYERLESLEFKSTLKNQGDVANNLLDQINLRYNNALLIQEIGQYSSTILDINTLLKYIMETLERRLDFDRGMIMLANADRTRLFYTVGYGYQQDQEVFLKSAEFHLDNPQSRGTFVLSFRDHKPFLVNDLEEIRETISKRSFEFAEALGVKSFICVPIVYEGQSEGILAVDNKMTKRLLGQSDMNLLMGIAPQIAIDINNARAYSLIRTSEQRFRSLSENAPDIIYNVDVNGIVTYVNPAVEKVLGFHPEEIIKRPLKDFICPENVLIFNQLSKEMQSSGAIIKDVAVSFHHKDGSDRIFDISGAPNFDKDGNMIGVVGVLRDVTALRNSEKELRNSLNKLQKIMDSTILAISKMVESRDPYTSGHQERVCLLASSIAEKMGLSDDIINNIRIAASLHDIGKINVPAEILSSPRKLTEIEYGMIKLHPEVGYDILNNIDFPGPIAKIVLQHHEMMDGTGYPSGIAGDNILLEARIIAVADVVESMASHRPYRPSLGIDQALAEIEAASGKRFDSAAVDACLDLFRKGQISFTEKAA
jgi:PAS domain S-box-containing protein